VGIHPEVFFVAGYAVFLLTASIVLDLLARHSHLRTERYRTAGFTYHHKSDAWIRPEDQILTRSEVDYERRLIRYRGRPQICNHCPAKADCTDSDDGREVVRAIDPWPHSEAGRFHRGISLSLTAVATLILTAELVRNHGPLELLVLGAALAVTATLARHIHKAFRASPANFPAATAIPSTKIPAEPVRSGYRKSGEARR
jgi:hypothetical protein